MVMVIHDRTIYSKESLPFGRLFFVRDSGFGFLLFRVSGFRESATYAAEQCHIKTDSDAASRSVKDGWGFQLLGKQCASTERSKGALQPSGDWECLEQLHQDAANLFCYVKPEICKVDVHWRSNSAGLPNAFKGTLSGTIL